ncbi:MAG: hypothetical protein VR67_07925 [Peptococcaceae bacterium BRH_c8a]|nr:MAG: hypothetical protein VR67_07925 [Peptococcaceae bacterium BRH_c8a]
MHQDNISTKITNVLESIVEWAGKITSWLILILIFSIAYEVVCRYFFNAPTFWSFDISYMVGGSAMVLGAAWTLKTGQQVRVDIFYMNMSPKKQAIADIIASVILFFPVVTIGLLYAIPQVIFSWSKQEKIYSGIWDPPIYPVKTVIAVAMLLLLIQGIAELIKNIQKLQRERGASDGS